MRHELEYEKQQRLVDRDNEDARERSRAHEVKAAL